MSCVSSALFFLSFSLSMAYCAWPGLVIQKPHCLHVLRNPVRLGGEFRVGFNLCRIAARVCSEDSS